MALWQNLQSASGSGSDSGSGSGSPSSPSSGDLERELVWAWRFHISIVFSYLHCIEWIMHWSFVCTLFMFLLNDVKMLMTTFWPRGLQAERHEQEREQHRRVLDWLQCGESRECRGSTGGPPLPRRQAERIPGQMSSHQINHPFLDMYYP